MSSSDTIQAGVSRRCAIGMIVGAGVLSSCGFQPVFGPGTAASRMNGQINVADIDGKMGFAARKRLTARLGDANVVTHRLDVAIDVESDGLAISQTNQITRYNLTGVATYKVVNLAANTTVETGTARAFAAYSATASPLATRVAEEDARERLAISLADQIATRIAATADRWLP